MLRAETHMRFHVWLSGAFTKLRKASISFGMSVRMEKLGYNWMDFHKILYLGTFRKNCLKHSV